MKFFKAITFVIVSLLLTVYACKKDDDNQPSKDGNSDLSTAYTARLNTVLDSVCKAQGIKGASAAILVPNIGIWKRAYGESHPGVPIRTDMAMTIGSNTKTYIATLMLKLQEQGLLNINDTIGKWLQGIPYTNGKATIKQLLNHSSGFGDFSYNPAFKAAILDDFNKIWKPEEAFPFFEPPYFTPPGSGYTYSDQNTVLAGLIIQKVTGKPVEKPLRDLVLRPANLPHTIYYPFEETVLTIPHSWSADYNANAILEDLDATYGYSRKPFCSADNAAGGMLSTAEENVKFWNLLMTGRIINQNSLNLMKDFIEPAGYENHGYGLCLEKRINALNGRTVYAHNGYVPGSVNDNAYDPQSGVCIAVLTNQDKVLDFTPILQALHKVTLEFKK